MHAGAVHLLEQVLLFFRHLAHIAHEQRLGKTDDGIQWCAQLMGHVGQKLALGPAGPLQLLVLGLELGEVGDHVHETHRLPLWTLFEFTSPNGHRKTAAIAAQQMNLDARHIVVILQQPPRTLQKPGQILGSDPLDPAAGSTAHVVNGKIEHLLGSSIGLMDKAIGIQHHHAIMHGLDDVMPVGTFLVQFPLPGAQGGYVGTRDRKPGQLRAGHGNARGRQQRLDARAIDTDQFHLHGVDGLFGGAGEDSQHAFLQRIHIVRGNMVEPTEIRSRGLLAADAHHLLHGPVAAAYPAGGFHQQKPSGHVLDERLPGKLDLIWQQGWNCLDRKRLVHFFLAHRYRVYNHTTRTKAV